MLNRHPYSGLAILLMLGISAVHAEDWSRFRGPHGSGVSSSKHLPDELSLENNLLWKIEAVEGTSSPITANGRVYFTSHQGNDRSVLCLAAETGKSLWTRSVTRLREENASKPGGPATCTPLSDGVNLIAFFPDAGLCCYSVSGKLPWKVDVGPFYSMHGVASSPILVDGKILLLVDQLQGSFLAAYELATGDVAWKVERLNGITGGYSTPALLAPSGKRDAPSRIVVAGPMKLVVYNVEAGESLLDVPGVTNAPVSLPVVVGQRVFLCEPLGEAPPFAMLNPFDADKDGQFTLKEVESNVPIYRLLQEIDKKQGNGDGSVDADEWDKTWADFVDKGGLTAVDLAGTDVDPAKRIKWNYRKTVPYIASVLVYENILYFLQDGGIVTSLDPDSGKVLKRGRVDRSRGKFYASPVAGDGKIPLVNTDGQLTVLKAGAQWEQLSSQPLGEPCFATPAVCNNRIYVRTEQTLFCFGRRKS